MSSFTSTSRSWRAYQMAAASVSIPAGRRRRRPVTPAVAAVTTTCMSPWTTTAATPTQRPSPTRRVQPQRTSWCELRWPSPRLASASSASSDNGGCYRSRAFAAAAAVLEIQLRRTRPFRPQTNGKAEAFNKTLQREWAYQRPYYSNHERLDALPIFLQDYNYARPHTSIGNKPPASLVSTTLVGNTPSPRLPGRRC